MGKRQETLIRFLKSQSNLVNAEIIPKPNLETCKKSHIYNELYKFYKLLNGQHEVIPFNIGNYDCVLNGTIVELDEENHFNRYRAITLQADIYSERRTLDTKLYVNWCRENESSCQARGNYWSTPSSEKQFGKSSLPGDMASNGSSRWRQRAFYDLLKDHAPILIGVPIKRLSIYQEIVVDGKKESVNIILKRNNLKDAISVYEGLCRPDPL